MCRAGIDGFYSNHSLRATRVHSADKSELITEQSGHRTDVAQQQNASDVVQGINRKAGNIEKVHTQASKLIKIQKGDLYVEIRDA